jgi:pyruvate dehydrogenase (quinone)
MKTTAADILIDTIHNWGVEVVFGLPGDGINGIMEALRKRADKIRFIQVRHEEAAAFMACACAKYTESSVYVLPLRARAGFIC